MHDRQHATRLIVLAVEPFGGGRAVVQKLRVSVTALAPVVSKGVEFP
jgi:hypothetical protein